MSRIHAEPVDNNFPEFHLYEQIKTYAGNGRTRQEIADDALEGFSEARGGMAYDASMSEAWQAGWHCWHEIER